MGLSPKSGILFLRIAPYVVFQFYRLFTLIQKLLYCYRNANSQSSHKNATNSSFPNQCRVQNLHIRYYDAGEKRE